MKFGRILKKLRTQSGKGIKRLAPELRVSYSYLSKLENEEIGPSEELHRTDRGALRVRLSQAQALGVESPRGDRANPAKPSRRSDPNVAGAICGPCQTINIVNPIRPDECQLASRRVNAWQDSCTTRLLPRPRVRGSCMLQEELAGAEGFEPSPSSLTVRCPTSWTTPQRGLHGCSGEGRSLQAKPAKR
jgi:hypothetical protein